MILGSNQSPYETFMQVAGGGLQIEADKLRAAMDKSRTLHQLLLRYVQVFMIQTSQTAVANAAAVLTQRLARWLLMCEDRLNAKPMLGVQRSGVTIALGELEDRQLIRSKRGQITIVDRPTLEKLTNGTAGSPRRNTSGASKQALIKPRFEHRHLRPKRSQFRLDVGGPRAVHQ